MREKHTSLLGTARPTDAMDVVLGHVGHVIVHNVTELAKHGPLIRMLSHNATRDIT